MLDVYCDPCTVNSRKVMAGLQYLGKRLLAEISVSHTLSRPTILVNSAIKTDQKLTRA